MIDLSRDERQNKKLQKWIAFTIIKYEGLWFRNMIADSNVLLKGIICQKKIFNLEKASQVQPLSKKLNIHKNKAKQTKMTSSEAQTN